MDKLEILLILLLIVGLSGCVNESQKGIQESNANNIKVLDVLGWNIHSNEHESYATIYPNNTRWEYPIVKAYDGDYINDNSAVSFLILQSGNLGDANLSRNHLKSYERTNPETIAETQISLNGMQIQRFEHKSGLVIYLWQDNLNIFRFWSGNENNLREIIGSYLNLSGLATSKTEYL